MGIAAESVRNPGLVPRFQQLGYSRPGAANLFIRTSNKQLTLVIDVLAPAWGRRLIPNQKHGDIVRDEIPGLSLALARPGEQIELTATMLDATTVSSQQSFPRSPRPSA